MMALDGLPGLQGGIDAARCKKLPVGSPGHGVYGGGMTTIGEHILAGGFLLDVGAPYLNRRISAGRGDARAIGRPRDGGNDIRVARVSENGRAVDAAANLYNLVGAGRGDAGAIGRPRDGVDFSGMTAIVEDLSTYIEALGLDSRECLHGAIPGTGGHGWLSGDHATQSTPAVCWV